MTVSFIDTEFEALASDKSGPQMGLVVGPHLTERQFAERYGEKIPAQVVLFENELGEPEVRAPGRDGGDT